MPETMSLKTSSKRLKRDSVCVFVCVCVWGGVNVMKGASKHCIFIYLAMRTPGVRYGTGYVLPSVMDTIFH